MTDAIRLARERRIRALLDDLRRILAADPALYERTLAALAGEIPGLEDDPPEDPCRRRP